MTSTVKKTKATIVLEALRSDIMHGVLTPGSRVQMDDLKIRYGVGFSPIREALFQLTSSGLVANEEHCGFTITQLSLPELRDLYNTRMLLEIHALELSITNGDEQWEADVVATWHLFSKYLRSIKKNKINPETWDELQANFYNALVKACESPWLLKISQLLYDQSTRYRYACLNNCVQDKKITADYLKQNTKLYEAVMKRNKKQATEILKLIWKESLMLVEAQIKL